MDCYISNEGLTDFEIEKMIEFRRRLNEIINSGEKLDEGFISDQMIRFLRFKDFDVDAAFRVLTKSLSIKLADEIDKIPYEEYKRVYDSQQLVFLKKRAPDGSKILWVRHQNWNIDEVDLITYVAGVYNYLDEALYSAKTQKCGFSILADSDGVGLVTGGKMLSYFTIDIVTQLIHFFQGSYPIKLKAVYFINSPLILSTFYAGIKYMLPRKIRQRLHIHSKGAEVLHKYFDKQGLPVGLKGSIPDEDAIDVKLLKAVNKVGISGGYNSITFKKSFIG